MPTHVTMRGIIKDFPGTRALDGINLEVFGSEIHAVVGENGAGKSTLMKILAGTFSDYVGFIEVNGKPVRIENPQTAELLGIAMIYQELNLVPRMTVAQNIYLGKEPLTRLGFVDKRKQEEDARKVLDSLKVSLDPGIQVIRLSPAERQIVEIAEAIASDPKILIMDEPTSSLPREETVALFEILRELRERGIAVLFISHKIEEVMETSDRVTVLRDGKLVASAPIEDWTEGSIVEAMVGREIRTLFPGKRGTKGEAILSVRGFNSGHKFQHVQFELHEGEVLGFYGLMGSGRTEVAEALFGLDAAAKGVVTIGDQQVENLSVANSVASGLFLLPEDRRRKGVVPRMSVESNLTMASLRKYCGKLFINARLRKQAASGMVDRLKIRTASQTTSVEFLSGGNQQKVVVGKCLLTYPDIIILDEPTRGIDVGTKAEIYEWIVKLADEGKGIILISSELPEILGLSDRILVFFEGRIVGELPRNEATAEKIMYLATGMKATQDAQCVPN